MMKVPDQDWKGKRIKLAGKKEETEKIVWGGVGLQDAQTEGQKGRGFKKKTAKHKNEKPLNH